MGMCILINESGDNVLVLCPESTSYLLLAYVTACVGQLWDSEIVKLYSRTTDNNNNHNPTQLLLSSVDHYSTPVKPPVGHSIETLLQLVRICYVCQFKAQDMIMRQESLKIGDNSTELLV